MTIKEAVQRVGRSESMLGRAIKAGKLRAEIIDGKYDITVEMLNTYAPPMRKEGAPRVI